MRTNKEK